MMLEVKLAGVTLNESVAKDVLRKAIVNAVRSEFITADGTRVMLPLDLLTQLDLVSDETLQAVKEYVVRDEAGRIMAALIRLVDDLKRNQIDKQPPA